MSDCEVDNASETKENPSTSGVLTCGFCGVTLYGEGEWHSHSASVHRVEQKWRWYNLLPTLKTLIVREIERISVRHGGDGRYDKANACKCTACSREFYEQEEFLEHLREYHNMVIDEDLLSYIEWEADKDSKNISITDDYLLENSVLLNSDPGGSSVRVKSEEIREDSTTENSVRQDRLPLESSEKQIPVIKVKTEVDSQSFEAEEEEVDDPLAMGSSRRDEATGRKKDTSTQIRVKSDKGQTQWSCRYCRIIFTCQLDLDNHKLAEHPESVRVRKRKKFEDDDFRPSSPVVQSSPLVIGAKVKVVCRFCNAVFDGPDALKRHIDSFHGNLGTKELHGRSRVAKKVVEQETRKTVHKRTPGSCHNFICDTCGEAR